MRAQNLGISWKSERSKSWYLCILAVLMQFHPKRKAKTPTGLSFFSTKTLWIIWIMNCSTFKKLGLDQLLPTWCYFNFLTIRALVLCSSTHRWLLAAERAEAHCSFRIISSTYCHSDYSNNHQRNPSQGPSHHYSFEKSGFQISEM